jgi:hypothetical protein
LVFCSSEKKKKDMEKHNLEDVVKRIIELNEWLCDFWSHAHGWAPGEAAGLMNKSRLDRQASLSRCLKIWIADEMLKHEDGALILAWSNLGSLIEGTLKLYLAAFYNNYKQADIAHFKDKKGEMADPDGLMLEKLRVFFNKVDLWSEDWDDYVSKVQQYRNAIHAFKDKEIGTFDDFESCVKKYLELIGEFNLGLPYPDEIGIPEIWPKFYEFEA